MATYTKTSTEDTTLEISVKADTGEKIWARFLRLTSAQKAEAQQASKEKWGITPNDWYIYRSSAMKPFSAIYGFFCSSAERHGLSPEFVHSVTMGEGLNLLIESKRDNGEAYDPSESIDAYQYLGADGIGANIDKLIEDGYIEAKHKPLIASKSVVNEKGEATVSGIIAGYETGVEVVAAELLSRKDWVLGHVSETGFDVDVGDTDVVDFLTYAAYNNPTVAKDAAQRITHYMRRYTGAERDDQNNVRFNTLKRLAASDWYKKARVYAI